MPAVAIIGTGFIGRSWAVVFARAGWDVRITDPSAEQLAAAPTWIRQALNELAAHGLAEDPEAAAQLVSPAVSIEEAVAGVDLVQENGPEVVDIKREVFAELDRLTPKNTILASSTSAIVASRFTDELAYRERCLVAHPVNPPHLVPLVELCGAPWTDPNTVGAARAIYESIGQAPVVVNREVEGFVLNRLQGALLSEALRLVEGGIMSPHDLDKTVKDGLGLRWSFMGPLETIELNAPRGIADYCARYGGFYRRLAADSAGPDVWDEASVSKVVAMWGEPQQAQAIAAKGAWRDSRLAALRAHKAAQSEMSAQESADGRSAHPLQ